MKREEQLIHKIENLEKTNIILKNQILQMQEELGYYKDCLSELKYKAESDYLTGIYNRSTICGILKEMLQADDVEAFAVCFLDLDNFKQINDNYGHGYGDVVLKRIAGILKESVGTHDLISRYGGDEFLICIRDWETEQAILKRLSRICHGIREMRLPQLPAIQRGADEQLSIRVTASIGVACYPVHGTELPDLLNKADEALYHSKSLGKDHVIFYQNG
ncbi:MAG: GGDEF domain-containing protein [Lachnospiraceae bacterium]